MNTIKLKNSNLPIVLKIDLELIRNNLLLPNFGGHLVHKRNLLGILGYILNCTIKPSKNKRKEMITVKEYETEF